MKAIERIYKYIDYKKIKAIPFERDIGLSNGYLGKQLKRNADLGEGILIKIIENCPDLSPEWLLTGNGEMLKKEVISENIKKMKISSISTKRKTRDTLKETQNIPLYELEATAGLQEIISDSPTKVPIIDYIRIPNLASCDGAIYAKGDSMYPIIKSGDAIAFKGVQFEDIFWGEIYLLDIRIDDWSDYITIKYVQKSELGDEYVKLVSQNKHHQPKDVLISKILAVALIRASIRLH